MAKKQGQLTPDSSVEDDAVSLSPLSTETAIKGLFRAPPPPPTRRGPTKKPPKTGGADKP